MAVLVYLFMGWLCLVSIHKMIATIDTGGLIWLSAGGFAYTFGVVFYLWDKLPYNHAIWHIFVLGGSGCHFFAVLFYVVPKSCGMVQKIPL